MVAIEAKGEIRARISRSPDLADACSMALGTLEPGTSCGIGGAGDLAGFHGHFCQGF